MAFGFGFNKTKVLSAAERCVQQGKLQNAITEYEKVAKQDPKDLTVLNTIGDLYARLGNTERAASYFRKVGDAYAADGFTVKAIAMYKKLTKLSPATTDCVLKLAELYTQQGLYNDARSQYVQIADLHLKAGEIEEASRILQKVLELDPENTALQAKLADLYVRLGKKTEARDILFRAADSLFSRGARDAADDALARILSVDPSNSRALLLRGRIALDAGKGAQAVEHLEKIADIDSLPEGLAALLRAYLGVGNLEEAGPIARKLLTVHNDLSGIRSYADALIAAGNCEQALHLYEENADRLLAAEPGALGEPLRALTGRLKENSEALQLVRALYQKAGDTTQIGEVTELLAHALVQAGDLEQARDLYQQLTELEPENTTHEQNYRQIVARLGQDTVALPLSEEEGAQPFMAEELEFTAPALQQEFPPEVAEAVRAAITESELFDSYNLPAKAIAPLEAVLDRAPDHAQLNQRLASLCARANRFAEAARYCSVLHRLYRTAGHPEQAEQYEVIAARYAQTPGVPDPTPAAPAPPAPSAVAGPLDDAPVELAVVPAELPEFSAEPAAPAFNIEAEAAAPPVVAQPPSAVAGPEMAPPMAHEFDLSDEWESALLVEPPASTESVMELPVPTEGAAEAAAVPLEDEAARRADAVADLVEEARFYLSQSMWEEAAQAVARIEAEAPEMPELADFQRELADGMAASAPTAEIEIIEEPVEEPPLAATPTVSTLVFDAAALGLPAAPPPPAPPVPPPTMAAPPPPAAVAAPSADVLSDFAAELDDSLGADFCVPPPLAQPPQVVAQPPSAVVVPPPVAQPPQVVAQSPSAVAAAAAPALEPADIEPPPSSALSDIFAEFKEGLEETSSKPEDTETHYNLGVAFKEMGLLDEAIGELQKVCHAIDHGESFPQVMQTYTWLAQCFVDKGVPEAGVRWYEKALTLPGDDDSSTALHYELACACEAAGDRKAALRHFMEVYGTNIDYRDVAERIKTLKS